MAEARKPWRLLFDYSALFVSVAYLLLLILVIPDVMLDYSPCGIAPDEAILRESFFFGVVGTAIVAVGALFIAGLLLRQKKVIISSFITSAGLVILLLYYALLFQGLICSG